MVFFCQTEIFLLCYYKQFKPICNILAFILSNEYDVGCVCFIYIVFHYAVYLYVLIFSLTLALKQAFVLILYLWSILAPDLALSDTSTAPVRGVGFLSTEWKFNSPLDLCWPELATLLFFYVRLEQSVYHLRGFCLAMLTPFLVLWVERAGCFCGFFFVCTCLPFWVVGIFSSNSRVYNSKRSTGDSLLCCSLGPKDASWSALSLRLSEAALCLFHI